MCDEETPFSLLLLRCFYLREVGQALHLSLPAHGTHARRSVSEAEGESVVKSRERGEGECVEYVWCEFATCTTTYLLAMHTHYIHSHTHTHTHTPSQDPTLVPQDRASPMRVGQERLGPSYFFISLVLGPLNSLVWYVTSLRYTRGLSLRIHCGVEVSESSTNKQHIIIIPSTMKTGLAVALQRTRCAL